MVRYLVNPANPRSVREMEGSLDPRSISAGVTDITPVIETTKTNAEE